MNDILKRIETVLATEDALVLARKALVGIFPGVDENADLVDLRTATWGEAVRPEDPPPYFRRGLYIGRADRPGSEYMCRFEEVLPIDEGIVGMLEGDGISSTLYVLATANRSDEWARGAAIDCAERLAKDFE